MNVKIDDKQKVTAAEAATGAVIGTIEGEALDTNITNKNGLDITREVIENVIASDDYKDGIKNRWFIGFLGHPEDPNCMDFQNAGVVMTEMWLDDNGKVFAKFNIVDTPVGQIIKKFTEAGVKFGISIRGAGDIIGSEVDPETFVFRGFDVVTFPAYPESVPEFKLIAASADPEEQKKYRAICAAVKENAPAITSASTIKELKSMFSPKSDVSQILEACSVSGETDVLDETLYSDDRIEAMVDMYLKACEEISEMQKALSASKRRETDTAIKCRRKIAAVRRITAEQLSSMSESLNEVEASCAGMRKTVSSLKHENAALKNSNLIYTGRIEANAKDLQEKDSIIAGLRLKLRETVTASTKLEERTSNLGDDNVNLRNDVETYRKALHEYQDAYAAMYAAQLGINPDGISVTDDMSVTDLRKLISSATNTANIPAAPSVEDISSIGDPFTGDDLITL
jgi:regulator of replication initiation timing